VERMKGEVKLCEEKVESTKVGGEDPSLHYDFDLRREGQGIMYVCLYL